MGILDDKIAIVTGGGSGIGRAMAETFAAQGAKVALVDVVETRVRETAEVITGRGGTVLELPARVDVEAEVDAFVAKVLDRWGRVDILCNNAGIMDDMRLPHRFGTEQWQRLFDVNVNGPFYASRAVLPCMIERQAGTILNTGSLASFRGGPAGMGYTASKHALLGMTRSIAYAYRQQGIRCNMIAPGGTITNITGSGLEGMDTEGFTLAQPMLALVGAPVLPQTMAEVALFMVSDAAAHINGVLVPIDGGFAA